MPDAYISPDPGLHRMPKRAWGPLMWRQLHDRPEQTGGDFSGEKLWLITFQQTIPCGECSLHFKSYMASNPPDLRSVAHYFAWTVRAHDDVNRRKRKPLMGWQEAWGEEPKD